MKVLMLNGSHISMELHLQHLMRLEKLLIMKELTMKYSRLVQMQ